MEPYSQSKMLNLFYKTISQIVITNESKLFGDYITCTAYPSKNAVKTFYPENIMNNNRLMAMQRKETLPKELRSDSFACTHNELLKYIILMQSTANRLIMFSQQTISSPDYVRDAYFCDTILLFNADLGTVDIDLIIAIWYNMYLQGIRVPKLVLVSKYGESRYLKHIAALLDIKYTPTITNVQLDHIEVGTIQDAIRDLSQRFTYTSGNYCIIVPTKSVAENIQGLLRGSKIYSENIHFSVNDSLKIVICLPDDFLGSKLSFNMVYDLNLVSISGGYAYNSESTKRTLSTICSQYQAYKYTNIDKQIPSRQITTAVLSFQIGILLVNHIDPRQIFEHDIDMRSIIDREILRLEHEGSIVTTGRVITLLPLKIRSINMHITISEARLMDRWLATGNSILPITIFIALKHAIGSVYGDISGSNMLQISELYGKNVPVHQRKECSLSENMYVIMQRFTQTCLLDMMSDNLEFIETYNILNTEYFYKIIKHVSLMLSIYNAETRISVSLGTFDIDNFYEVLATIIEMPILELEGDILEKTYKNGNDRYNLPLKDSIIYSKMHRIVLVDSKQEVSGKRYITCYFPIK